MSTSQHIIAMLRSHLENNSDHLLSLALQYAAKEARVGHTKVAQEIRELVDRAQYTKLSSSSAERVDGILTTQQSETRLRDLILETELESRLKRVVLEHRQRDKLLHYSFQPRNKLLLVGPPGTGKTITAKALAGELQMPLNTVMLEGLITKFMGETAAKLRTLFEHINEVSGVYFFDEFDAIGASRASGNDVGEMRRILNTFLQLLENVSAKSVVIGATNYPELLDIALSRRFDDVLFYQLPSRESALKLLKSTLIFFDTENVEWESLVDNLYNMSQAEIVKAASEAAKTFILKETASLTTNSIKTALLERNKSQVGSIVKSDAKQ
jgi:SpoVK/Ycf46/Vps4 family AAA+-type ATPase